MPRRRGNVQEVRVPKSSNSMGKALARLTPSKVFSLISRAGSNRLTPECPQIHECPQFLASGDREGGQEPLS